MSTASSKQFQASDYAREGLLALQRGHYRMSNALLIRAVQMDPTLGEAWRWLGALHSGSRRNICLQWARYTIPNATIPNLPKIRRPIVVADQAPTETIEVKPRHPMRRVGLIASSAVLATLLAVGGFELAYSQRMYPGVHAVGQALGGMSPTEAAQTIAPQLAAWSKQRIVIHFEQQQFAVPFDQLASFDANTIAQQAFNLGREGNPIQQIKTQGQTLLNPTGINLLALDHQRLNNVYDQIETHIQRPAIPAHFSRNPDGTWSVVPEQIGVQLDRAVLTQNIQQWWSNLDWAGMPASGELQAALINITPSVTAAQLDPFVARLNQQTAQPLTLNIAGQTQTFDRAELLNLSLLPVANNGFAADSTKIQAIVRDLAQQYDRAPQASKLVRDGNRASEWQLGQNGLSINQASAIEQIKSALQTGNQTPLDLVVITTPPPAGELEALGITGIVGRGDSQFAAYSSPNRDANVVAGGNEFDGLLVAPGELISFTGTVGDITPEKGYEMGEMISGGMVIPSYGGGICQVSTTMFRAAFWAGLPIEERHNHDWRLAWYETDAPAGMDATIALNGPDLKIRNNTDGYLLIDVETDTVNKTQTFTLYGTPKQQEIALIDSNDGWGGIVITRQIKQNGVVVQEDSWTSYYSQ